MARSAIYVVNNATQNVVNNGNISLGTVIRRFGCNLFLEGNAIRESGSGYYKYIASFTVAPTAVGTVTIAAYKDGVLIPGALASEAVSTANNPTNLGLVFMTKENCACCEDISNISFVLTTTAPDVNITNVAITGEKL